jgi:hypothetical protein
VFSLTVYNDELIAGGDFHNTNPERVPLNSIARWDGSAWRPLGPGFGGATVPSIFALTVYQDTLLIAGGNFTTVGDSSISYIAQWNGSRWAPLGSGPGTNGWVRSLTVYQDSLLIAGGNFTTIGGTPANRIAAWDGTQWTSLGNGANDAVVALTTFQDSLLIAGGYFTAMDGLPNSARIAQWNGTQWSSMGGSASSTVFALTEFNEEVVAGGAFGNIGGTSAIRIAAWNGSSWRSLGYGLNDEVYSLAVLDQSPYGPVLVAGGDFGHENVVELSMIRVGWWCDSIAEWRPFYAAGYGADDRVQALTAYDGDMIMGGKFKHIHSPYPTHNPAAGHIARINMDSASAWLGTTDTLHARCDFPVDLATGNINKEFPDRDELAMYGYTSRFDVVDPMQHLYFCGIDGDTTYGMGWSDWGNEYNWGVDGIAASRRVLAVADITGYDYTVEGASPTMNAVALVQNAYGPFMVVADLRPDSVDGWSWFNEIPIVNSSSASRDMSELILADLDTLTLTVGPPHAYRVDSVLQLLAVVNAPPTHYDILNDTVWDVSNRYPVAGQDPNYDTYVEYYNSQGFTTTTETEMHRDWGISYGLEQWAQAGPVTVRSHLEAEYGDGFSKQQGTSEIITIGSNITARSDDRLHYVRASYDVLEYPVFWAGAVVGHLVVASPAFVQEAWAGCKSIDAVIPNHEAENVLSYPRPADIEANPMVDTGSGLVGDLVAYTMEPMDESQWYLGQATFENSSVTETWDVGVTAGVSASASSGFSIFGFGVRVGSKQSISGHYRQGEVSTFKTEFSDLDSLHVQLARINSAGDHSGNRRYEVTPYSYWAKNGALVIDYAAEPVHTGTTWWNDHYSDPDPALLLPWRLDNEKWEISDPEVYRYKTKEIVFLPDNPASGDSVLISVRVHNYSLVPTPPGVKVSLYLGDPEGAGVILADKNSGDTVFLAEDSLAVPVAIPQQGWAVASMVWQVPDLSSIPDCPRIWAVIDPEDDISPEVHDNTDPISNNRGWTLLYPSWASACTTAVCPVTMTGDVNISGSLTASDIIALVNYVFKGGDEPEPCAASGDVNCNGSVTSADVIYLVNHVFKGGDPPSDVCTLIPGTWTCP